MEKSKYSENWGNRESFNLLVIVAMAQATCVTVFTRTKFGAEALGIPGIGALILLWFWVLGTHSPDLLVYGGLWLCAFVLQRVQTMMDCWKGNYQHSRYGGIPIVLGRFCKSERMAKLREGFGFCLFGLGVNPVDWRIGYFFTASGVAILFIEWIHVEVDRKRQMILRDAESDARHLTRRGVMNRG
jgi:hypothetical protein